MKKRLKLKGRRLKKLNKLLKKIKRYHLVMESMSDAQLSGLTREFKQELADGKSLDSLLPKAFAAICEADYRILGKRPYDVQILGAIALHQGYLAEMNTGEGKTLVATMPLYLNALTGKSTILVTTNEYLALRDAEEMGPVYEFMGLSVRAGVQAKASDRFTNEEKKEIYAADIVYTTHGVLGFDYLFNNLVTSAEDRFLREFYYIIIDEADSVLLDSAQTPLVISGSPRVQSNLYELADFFVTTLKEDLDYEQEDGKVWLTDEGVLKAESFFQIDNFYLMKYFEINRHVILALRAHVLFIKEKDYMVDRNDELLLLDGGSGRAMPGVKLRGGVHQAIEVKEGIEASQENRSMASITYQNFFLLFPKMSGMSGTISDAKEEIFEIYKRRVLVIPPNRAVKRKDYKDFFFKDAKTQFERATELAFKLHEKGQPVLIVVSTIAETELVSQMMLEKKIAHNVLNANNAFWEADMVKEAGQKYAVTIATSMAGRGTDIRLGEGVKELGGLAVIGIGRMANIRQERQAKGRSGRQGDPGFSRFFVSLEDEVVKRNGPDNLEKLLKQKHISKGRLKRIIRKSQDIGEENAIYSRRQAMDYDRVLRRQRQLIYEMRDKLLDGEQIELEKIEAIAKENIKDFVMSEKNITENMVNRFVLDNLSYRLDGKVSELALANKKILQKDLYGEVEKGMAKQREKLGSAKLMDEFLRRAILHAIDDAWVEQVDYLQQLQSAVSGRSFAQRNLLLEYQNDSFDSYDKMKKQIYQDIMRNILLSNVTVDKEENLHMILP